MRYRGRSTRSGRTGVAVSLLTAAVALLPSVSCPACWPVYAGLLSALGVPVLMSREALFPTTLVALCVAVFVIGFRATRRHGYGPFVLSLISAMMIVVGKFILEWDVIAYLGVAMLVFASVWNSRQHSHSSTCLACNASQNLIQIDGLEKFENNS